MNICSQIRVFGSYPTKCICFTFTNSEFPRIQFSGAILCLDSCNHLNYAKRKNDEVLTRSKNDGHHQEPPLPLKMLAGAIVNNLPKPDPWEWDVDDVVSWLINIGLPQYEKCFRKNFITGKRLIWIDSSSCLKIGIQDFHDIQVSGITTKISMQTIRITAAIRKLFGIELEKFRRSISLPPRYPFTHFLLFNSRSGAIRETMSCTQLFYKMGILQETEYNDMSRHWKIINPVLTEFPSIRFGRS